MSIGTAIRGITSWIRHTAGERPLLALILGAATLRLIAALFSRGYMASDDHMQVVEIAAEWFRGNRVFIADGQQFYRSLLYPGFHWALFSICRSAGIQHPDTLMMVVRLALAAWSLWAVAIAWRFGYALGTNEEAGRRIGLVAGWIVAAHAILPYASVRSLVETASLPLLLYSLWALHTSTEAPGRTESGSGIRLPLLAGVALGIGIVIRIQIGFAALGAFSYLLITRRLRILVLCGMGAALPLIAQGLWDLALSGEFLGSFAAYLRHNRAHMYDYVIGPWYRYILLALGAFVPPFSILLLAAAFVGVRRRGVLFWATLSFFVIHSLVPQKQERFLLPILPQLALLGVAGLEDLKLRHGARFARLVRRGWILFWAVNIPIMLVSLFNYGQKARIEPLLYIYERGDARTLIADLTEQAPWIPAFYYDGGDASRSVPIVGVRRPDDFEKARQALASADQKEGLDYVVIFSSGRLEEHLELLDSELGTVRVVHHFPPGPVDRILRLLNPRYNRGKESWLGVMERPS